MISAWGIKLASEEWRRAAAEIRQLTRTTLALPFGPEGAFPSDEKTERLRQTDGVVAVSRYVADYIRVAPESGQVLRGGPPGGHRGEGHFRQSLGQL